MSALPPTTDVVGGLRLRCFVPLSDSSTATDYSIRSSGGRDFGMSGGPTKVGMTDQVRHGLWIPAHGTLSSMRPKRALESGNGSSIILAPCK